MNKKLFVGRLPFGFSNDQLRALFIKSGTVVSAVMVPDAKSGKTRGFGFVDMSTEAEAQAAIQTLNGSPLEDKKIWVTLAREKGDAKQPAPFPKNGRRPFRDRPTFNDHSGPPGFGPKKHSPAHPAHGRRPLGGHFADGPSGAAFGDRKPPFRGKRAFPGTDARSSEQRPGGSPRAGGPARFPKKEFRKHFKTKR